MADERKLLLSNPWSQFTWIEGHKRPIRQFDSEELLSLMNYLETEWGGASIAATAVKVFLWSGCQKLEISGLTWSSLWLIGNEYHFEIIGKWAVERWFRIPEAVYQELKRSRTKNPWVFAIHNEQLRNFQTERRNLINGLNAEFSPTRFGNWIYRRD